MIDSTHNPTGLEVFYDLDGDGEFFDDSFLVDSRLRPLPHPGATKKTDRYSVVIPPGTRGPIAVSTAVYYQSMEAIVGQKFLGNMTDTNNNMVIEPCVLGGRCDGRKPQTEPAVVEGAPPVPMAVKNFTIAIAGTPGDATPPRARASTRQPGAPRAHLDTVPKVFFSRPVTGVSATHVHAHRRQRRRAAGVGRPDRRRRVGPVRQPDPVQAGRDLHGAPRRRDLRGGRPTACTQDGAEWTFTIAADAESSDGDSGVPLGFSGRQGRAAAACALRRPPRPPPRRLPLRRRQPLPPRRRRPRPPLQRLRHRRRLL